MKSPKAGRNSLDECYHFMCLTSHCQNQGVLKRSFRKWVTVTKFDGGIGWKEKLTSHEGTEPTVVSVLSFIRNVWQYEDLGALCFALCLTTGTLRFRLLSPSQSWRLVPWPSVPCSDVLSCWQQKGSRPKAEGRCSL